MAQKTTEFSILRALGELAILVIATFLIHATPAGAAAARSVADATPATPDPAYKKLTDAANAVVGLKVTALGNARSNASLGQERVGSGVVIGKDGLILTAAYMLAEANEVQVTDSEGTTVPAAVVAYDHASGFGLVRSLGPLATKPIALGTSAPVAQLDRLMIVSGGTGQSVSLATVVSKRPFAGYWEYLIDDAIFTSPPRLDHSGAALINKDGELVGIGSLFVMDALKSGEKLPGNMFLPVDLLKPILDELVRNGAQQASHRPWLGVDSLEEDGRVKVMMVDEESPAAQAGIEAGDIILSVAGRQVDNLADFYRTIWTRGPAGVEIPLTVLHGPALRTVVVRTIDRQSFMRRKPDV